MILFSNFLFTLKHITVMSCLIEIRHLESTYHTLFIIVAHCSSGAIVRQCIVNYPYCDLTALIYEVITLIIDIEIS